MATQQYTPGRRPGFFQAADGSMLIAGTETLTDWAISNDDITNLALSTSHIIGTKSIEFDKTDGDANSMIAGVAKTLPPGLNLTPLMFSGGAVGFSVYLLNKTNVAYAFIQLGTDSSNYHEWRVAATGITPVTWDSHIIRLLDPSSFTGIGWDSSKVTYVSVGLKMDAEGNALADIKFDHIHARP